MYFTSSIADDIRVPLQINVVCLVLLQPRRRTPHQSCSNNENRPSQWSSTLSAVSRGLRSSSPPPKVTPALPSSTSIPMMLRSTRLCQSGCTLVASLCYSAFMSIPQASFAMELLWYYYSRIWLEGVEQSKNGGFFSFGVTFKEKL